MNLIDKIKDSTKKLALTGALGSSLYLNGCIAHGSPREMSNFVVQDILGLRGLPDKDKGNQNQIGPQGNQQQVSTQKNHRVIFSSFKRWNDINGDGFANYPQEFFGETNSYSINENIILYVNMQGNSTNLNATTFVPSLLKMKAQIVDSRTGDLKETQEKDLTKYGYITGCDWCIVPKSFLKEGSYRVLWYYNIADLHNAPWCYLGSYDFSVNH